MPSFLQLADTGFYLFVFQKRIYCKCPQYIDNNQCREIYKVGQAVCVPYSQTEVGDKYAQRNIRDQVLLLIYYEGRMISVIRRLYIRCADALLIHAEIVIVYSAGNCKLRYATSV